MESTDGAGDATHRAESTRDASLRAAERTAEAAKKLEQNRQTMKRLSGEVAETEEHLATTLRKAASSAARQGRTADAERLTGEAEHAERYAALERRRADGD